MRWYLAAVLALVLTVSFANIGRAEDHPCTVTEAQKAESEAVGLRTWDALRKSYQLYRRCDDGAIAEGYSESVVRILVDHWNSLPRLAALVKLDPSFRKFVLGHIDATLNVTDVEKIKNKAEKQCPAGLGSLCGDLKKQAEAALKENASP